MPLLVAALALPAGAAAGAKRGRQCRRECDVAVSRCIQAGTTALAAQGLTGKRLQRKGKRVRRRCRRDTQRGCRHDGPDACERAKVCSCTY